MGEVQKCKEKVWDSTGWFKYPCRNKAKYGEYCGVHSPEKRRERAEARGPSAFEKKRAARKAARQNLQDKARPRR